jgi:hypothetical protein
VPVFGGGKIYKKGKITGGKCAIKWKIEGR